jgi:hypothetical protein
MTHELHPNEILCFGADAVRHPVSGMLLEQGSGALPPDEQARRIHLPYIARTQGAAAAQVVALKLDAEARRIEIMKGTQT